MGSMALDPLDLPSFRLQMDEAKLRAALEAVDPKGRQILRRLATGSQTERDRYSEALLRRGTKGEAIADIVDLASTAPDFRRLLARVLGELEASGFGTDP